MAQRTVNTKFVITMAAVLTVSAGSLAGIYLYQRMKNRDPKLLEAKAIEEMKAGHRQKAFELYSQAYIHLDKQTPKAAEIANVLADMLYDDSAENPEMYRKAVEYWQKAAVAESSNKVALEHLLKEYYESATHGVTSWGEVEKQASDLIRIEPNNADAYLDRGIAVLRQVATDHLGDRFASAEADIRKAVDLGPDNIEATYNLSLLEMTKAKDLDTTKTDDIQKLKDSAIGRLKAFKEKFPNNAEARIDYSEIINPNDPEKPATASFEELKQAAVDFPDNSKVFLALYSYYSGKYFYNPVEQVASLRKAADLDTGNLLIRYHLGKLYEDSRDLPNAVEAFSTIVNSKGTVKGLNAEQRKYVVAKANEELCWVYLSQSQIAGIKTPDGKAAMDRAQSLIDGIQHSRPTDPIIKLFQGRVSFLNGDFGVAALALRQADAVFSGGDRKDVSFTGQILSQNWARTKQLLIVAHANLGEFGEALKHLNGLMEGDQKNNPQLLFQKATYLLALRQYRDAINSAMGAEQVAAAMKVSPNPWEGLIKPARQLQERAAELALNATGPGAPKPEERQAYLKLIEELRKKGGDAEVTLGSASDLMMTGDFQKAVDKLKPMVDAQPDNMDAKLQLATAYMLQASRADTAGDATHAKDFRGYAKELMDDITQKSKNPAMLQRVKMMQMVADKPTLTSDDVMQEMIKEIADPYDQAIAWAGYYMQHGKVDEQIENLKKAEAIKPDEVLPVTRIFELLLAKKDWDQAQKYQQKAELKNMDAVNGKFFQGQLELSRDHLSVAIALLKNVVALRPEFADGQNYLGLAYLANGQVSEALDAYNNAIEQSPNMVPALKGLIQIYMIRRDTTTAANYLSTALTYAPQDPVLRNFEDMIGDPSAVIARREARRKLDTTNKDIDNLTRLAMVYTRRSAEGDMQRAVDVYKPVYDALKSHFEVSATMAQLCDRDGQTDAAMKIYQNFITSDNKQEAFTSYWLMGDLARSHGSYNEAEVYYKTAIEGKPTKDDTTAERKLADMYFETQHYKEADASYGELVTATKGEDPRVLNRYVESLVRESKFDVADKLLTGDVLKKNPTDPDAMVLLGFLRMSQGTAESMNEAADQFAKVIAMYPKNTSAYHYRAIMEITRHGNLAQAQDDLTMVRRMDPTNTKSRQALAELYVRTNKVAEALQEFKDTLVIDPELRVIRLEEAQFLMTLERSNKRIPEDNTSDYKILLKGLRIEDTLKALLNESIQKYPKEPVWVVLMGNFAEILGDKKLALQCYSKVWHDQNEAPPASIPLLNMLLKEKQFEDVVSYTTAMMKQAPDLLELQLRRADAYAGENKPQEALADFQHALDVTAGNATDYVLVAQEMAHVLPLKVAIGVLQDRLKAKDHIPTRLALAQLQQEAGDYQPAADVVRPLLNQPEAKPVKHLVYRVLALADFQAGRYQQAADNYRALLEITPNDMDALNNLAFILADNLKKPADGMPFAIRAVEALKMAPGESVMVSQGNVYDTYGWVLFLSGKQEDAEAALKRSVLTDPAPTTYYHLAMVQKAENHLAAAKDTVQMSVKMAKDSKDAILEKALALLGELGG